MEQSAEESAECGNTTTKGEGTEELVEFEGNSESRTDTHKIKKGGLEELVDDTDNFSSEASKVERSPHGSVAFIYYRDPKTGITEYLFEQNKEDYALLEERGKIRLIGGARDYIGGRLEGSLEALVRELGQEEFKNPVAGNKLTKDKSKIHFITRVSNEVNRQIAYTDIYAIEVKSKSDWNIIKTSDSSRDTGIFRVFTDKTALKLDDRYYAFGSADVIKNFIIEKMPVQNGIFSKISNNSSYGRYDSIYKMVAWKIW